MYKELIAPGKHIHFIGIGGVSMSGLAKILKRAGVKVTGSDINHSSFTDSLEADGIAINFPHTVKNIKGADLVVYTAAVKSDNPEMIYTKENNIPAIERAKLLGIIMEKYESSIAVSGTHGKTTVTSMIATALLKNNFDPTITVGGDLPILGGNLKIGESDIFLTEACEYVDSFLNFFPSVSLILNVEEDHLDYFSGIEQIKQSFRKFAGQTSKTVIANGDDENIKSALSGLSYLTFGFSKNCDYSACDIKEESYSTEYTLKKNGTAVAEVSLTVKGKHNILNSLAAISCCDVLGLDIKAAADALSDFTGAKRRLEYKGSRNGFVIYDDYAHHPTEIKATLEAIESIPHKNVWCIFQPHTYTRTKALMDDFAEVLKIADKLILTDIYAAREKDTGEVSSAHLADKIPGSILISSFEDIENFILKNAEENDIVLTMGAGTVFKIGDNLLDKTTKK